MQSTHHPLKFRRSAWTLIFWLGACDSPKQAPSMSRAGVPSDSLAERIDHSLPTLRRDTATVFGLSAEGASLEAAYRDTTLQRLRAVYFGETGRATETYYFDSVAFLLVRGQVRYDAPLSGRVAESTTTRFDLRANSMSQAVRDSLQAEARVLLGHLTAKRRQ